jgi:DNA-binding LacI/PurR family transcriptional regulator
VTIDNRQRKATIHLRSYSWERQEWVKDIQSTGDESNGQIDVRLPRKEQIRPPKGRISFGAHPADELRLEEPGWIVTLVGDSSHGFFSEVIRGISDTLGGLSRNGAPLSTIVCSHDDRSWVEEAHLRNLIQKPIAGMIIAASSYENPNGPLFDAFMERNVPIVQIDRRIEGIERPWVGIDNASAGYSATSHLIQHGHSRLAAIGGRQDVSTNSDRFDGFCKALRELDGTEGISLWNCSHWETSRITIKELLSRRDRPTALFCMNGMATLGAMLAIRESMLRVPEDVALIGFDDSPWCLLAEPPITMIRQPARAIGETAAELVWKALYQNSTEGDHYCPWELVVRRSCGCE